MFILRNISLSFGNPPLLDRVTLEIKKRERICIVGRNGAGKSTLLKIIGGEIKPDDGEFIREGEIRIQTLPQDIPDKISGTIESILRDEAEKNHLQDWEIDVELDQILSQTGLEPEWIYNELSAGLKRRAILGRCIASRPDLLLLDEPTNHLDIEAITWLEEYLLQFRGALVFITHDRAFLQRLATRIADVDRGRLTTYNCDYENYLVRKEALLEGEEKQNAVFDKKLAQEEVWIRQGIKARRTRNEGRVRNLKKMRLAHQNRRTRTGNATMSFDQAANTGVKVIEAKNIRFGYDNKLIVSNFSAQIDRGYKVGIIGPNGTGKTTLIKLLLGELVPQEGIIEHGSNLKVAYFDQLREQLDPEATVIDCVADGNESVEINGKQQHIISYLKNFLFTPDRVRGTVKLLSGGEKNRLLLARLFTRPFNVLVMDEPTNDLDVETLDLLEELLSEFSGTLILVSHDRAFINNVVTDVIALEGKGEALFIAGGYDDYLAEKIKLKRPSAAIPLTEKKEKPKTIEKPKKLLNRERWELEALPKEIETLENEIEVITHQLADPDFYKDSPTEVEPKKDRLKSIEAEIAQKYERWDSLEQLRIESEGE